MQPLFSHPKSPLHLRAALLFTSPAYAELTSREVGLQLSRAGIRLAFVLNQALVATAN
jgi:hypothetical protein